MEGQVEAGCAGSWMAAFIEQDPTALSCMRYPEQKTLQAIRSIVHKSIADSSHQISKTELSIHCDCATSIPLISTGW